MSHKRRDEPVTMAKFRLAQESNQYAPDLWLGEKEALALLQASGYQFTKLRPDFVKKQLETGGPDGSLYISKRSVESYIARRKHEEAENAY
jgi:hypothetical protein